MTLPDSFEVRQILHRDYYKYELDGWMILCDPQLPIKPYWMFDYSMRPIWIWRNGPERDK
jgi:hypothetical protein